MKSARAIRTTPARRRPAAAALAVLVALLVGLTTSGLHFLHRHADGEAGHAASGHAGHRLASHSAAGHANDKHLADAGPSHATPCDAAHLHRPPSSLRSPCPACHLHLTVASVRPAAATLLDAPAPLEPDTDARVGHRAAPTCDSRSPRGPPAA